MQYGNTEVFLTRKERDALIRKYMGKTVSVIVDRPIGYVHQTKGITLHYTVNYGFLPGVMGGDGEEQDVYILGVAHPVDRFTGRIIAAVRRLDDNEDKLVAAPEGMVFHQQQIADAVDFVEKYFISRIDALTQCSCGVIPYRRTPEGIRYLLILQTNGFWSLPKGHMERNETEVQTACRELLEETGLTALLHPDFREMVSYPMSGGRTKQVVLFPGAVSGPIRLQQNEAVDFRWVTAAEARQLLHPDFAGTMERVQAYLEDHHA